MPVDYFLEDPENPVRLPHGWSVTDLRWPSVGAVNILGTYLAPSGFLSPTGNNPPSSTISFWQRGTISGSTGVRIITELGFFSGEPYPGGFVWDNVGVLSSNFVLGLADMGSVFGSLQNTLERIGNSSNPPGPTNPTSNNGRWITRILGYSGPDMADGLWHHVAASWDGASKTGQFLIDGVLYTMRWDLQALPDTAPDHPAFNFDSGLPDSYGDTYAAQFLFCGQPWSSNTDPSNVPRQSDQPITVADVWLKFGVALDLSDAEVAAKLLRVSDGTPVALGANGELVTGTQPDLFLHVNSSQTDGNQFAINRGSGGTLTRVGNSISMSSSIPKIGT
jgi:hypothetical protein